MVSVNRREYLRYGAAIAGLSLVTSASAETDDGENEPTYEPTWESIGEHEVPDWYHDAKLGIFIHWGPYAVPGWAPVGQYAEWYPNYMHNDGSATNGYHEEHYGAPVPGDADGDAPPFEYKDFVRDTDDSDAPENFDAADWNPDRWATLFEDVGAGYVVPVGEHHDGFAMWDADRTDWNAARMGPKRDVIKELSESVREHGMKFAASYHRMMNYYDPEYTGLFGNPHYDGETGPDEEFVRAWQERWYDLVEHVEPDLLWWDGDWTTPASTWESKRVVADYLNTAEREWGKEVAVNDRLGQVRGEHGDFFTPEYTSYDHILAHKWETCRGIGHSFGYNRQEGPEDHLSVEELVQSFVDIVSKNGNLLLNVGPKRNGRIPDVQRERLRGLGEWLDVNGEAIFGTRYWIVPDDETNGVEVRYTTKNNRVYAVLFDWPGETARLRVPEFVDMKPGFRVEMLGVTNGREGRRYLDWEVDGDDLVVRLPDERPSGEHAEHAYALKVQVARPDENAFEHAAGNANGNSRIIESRDELRNIVRTPDLRTSLSVSEADGDSVTLTATVTNRGNDTAPATTVRFEDASDGTTTIATGEVPELAVNRSTTVSAEWDVVDLPTGAYEVRATVDPDGRIDEVTESNNEASVGVLLPPVGLAGEWRFRRGDDAGWKEPGLDDDGWETVVLPSNWEDHSDYTEDPAYGWYRRTASIPEEWAGRDLRIPLGRIDDVDETFVNGTKVGQSGTFPDDFSTAWGRVREYSVPAEELNFGGENVVAIRVYDGQGGGGLYDGPLGPIEVATDR